MAIIVEDEGGRVGLGEAARMLGFSRLGLYQRLRNESIALTARKRPGPNAPLSLDRAEVEALARQLESGAALAR